MKITGIIEAKKLGKSGEGEYGAWQVHEFTINGHRYSTFKQSIYDMFSVGQSVEMEGEKTEKGFKMKTIEIEDEANRKFKGRANDDILIEMKGGIKKHGRNRF